MLGPLGLAAQADSCCRAPSRSTKRPRKAAEKTCLRISRRALRAPASARC